MWYEGAEQYPQAEDYPHEGEFLLHEHTEQCPQAVNHSSVSVQIP